MGTSKKEAAKKHWLGTYTGPFSPIESLRLFPQSERARSLTNKEIWESIIREECPICGQKLEFSQRGSLGRGFTVFHIKSATCVNCHQSWAWEEED